MSFGASLRQPRKRGFPVFPCQATIATNSSGDLAVQAGAAQELLALTVVYRHCKEDQAAALLQFTRNVAFLNFVFEINPKYLNVYYTNLIEWDYSYVYVYE